ncbi:MAG: hypothetical protein K1000chlam2_01015, partial [Chlamydiae bacterium]|nr:hypothetical protein [Chlamydiota bacterium]
MNKKIYFLFLIPLLLTGCRTTNHSDSIVSIQTVDRNGFSETISNKERLHVYQQVDFLNSQPYEKVLRVYGKNNEGKSHSKLTSYHSNGEVWQFLEALDGRAHGSYIEWHENGKVKIEATIIEGLADLGERAKNSWLFDKECTVWDEQGDLLAEFIYDKGYLEGDAKYYYPSGKLQKIVPHTKGSPHGALKIFNEEGKILEEIHYKNGHREGAATASWVPGISKYQEQYREGKMINAIYFNPEGTLVAEIENGIGQQAEFRDGKLYSLIEYHHGIPEGQVKTFDSFGNLHVSYWLKEGKKQGEEWQYYPSSDQDPHPKLLLTWFDDRIQGVVKTWYENGILESQREMSGNKKHGLSFAYYRGGDLMLMEEYENDKLCKGSYFKKGEHLPTSTIENGEGTATLYHAEGHFLNKVPYEKGKPVLD